MNPQTQTTPALPQLLDLTGKVALVTGSSRNLGRSIAREFARAGASVALNASRSADELEEAAAELRSHGHTVLAELVDLTDRPAVEQMVERVRTRLGPIDVVVI